MVETTGTGVLSRQTGQPGGRPGEAVVPGTPVIEVRWLALGGRVKIVRPRLPRWFGGLSRRRG